MFATRVPSKAPFGLVLGMATLCAVGAASADPKGGKAPASTSKPALPVYDLKSLVERARSVYPGVVAARHALAGMKQSAYRAKWAWVPQAELNGLLAPSPEIRCEPDADTCLRTAQVDGSSINIAGIFGRIELKLGLPLYTFDKIGSAQRAARAGVAARQAQLQIAADDVELKLTEAYWGVKLADELILTITEGTKHIVKARAKIEQQLDDDEGDVTVTDLLRVKTFAAEISARLGEAQKLKGIAMDGVATLARLEPGGFALDKSYLQPLSTKLGPLAGYLARSKQHRPEIEALRRASQAQQAAVDLEKAKFLPDFLIVAALNFSKATGVDDPHNSFLSDPYNSLGFGFGLAMNWKLDTVQQVGRYRAARAKALEVEAKRAEALAGIDMQIRKEYRSLQEAVTRLEATKKGQRAARSWLVATSQNLAAGLAKTKDLTDALLAYFQLRVRYLQGMFDLNTAWAKLGRAVGKQTAKMAPRS